MAAIEDLLADFEAGECLTAADLNDKINRVLQFACENFQTKGEPGPAPLGAVAEDGSTEITGPLCYGEGVAATADKHLVSFGQLRELVKNLCQCFSDRTSVVTDENGIACINIPPGEVDSIFGAVASVISPAEGFTVLSDTNTSGDPAPSLTEVCFVVYNLDGTLKVNEPVNLSYVVMGQ